MIFDYIKTLESEFEMNSNPTIANQQKAYMKGQFEYYGMKSPERRELQKPFLAKAYLPDKGDLNQLIKLLWMKPQRDFQYFAQELAFKYIKMIEEDDISMYEYMVIHKPWWDTIDFIAVNLMGNYFKEFPDKKIVYVEKWLKSEYIWLQRCALLFQLKYKTEIDTSILSSTIQYLLGSKEFFINKAIGWVLREYSRTDPNWVLNFVEQTELSKLSKREALRLIK